MAEVSSPAECVASQRDNGRCCRDNNRIASMGGCYGYIVWGLPVWRKGGY
jgi:hypothetical protein